MDTLDSLSDMLELVAGELQTRAVALPELTEYLCERCSGQATAFLENLADGFKELGRENFCDLWKKASEKINHLNRYEIHEFVKLGKILGRCELDIQVASVRRTEQVFRREYEKLHLEFPQKRKLNYGLCGGAGLILLIMLI